MVCSWWLGKRRHCFGRRRWYMERRVVKRLD
jgi:hypothetical protein